MKNKVNKFLLLLLVEKVARKFRRVVSLSSRILTFVLAERTRSRIDQGKLEMLQRGLQLSRNLENQAQPQVYLIGSAIDRVNVQKLLERFDSPVGEMTTTKKQEQQHK